MPQASTPGVYGAKWNGPLECTWLLEKTYSLGHQDGELMPDLELRGQVIGAKYAESFKHLEVW